MLGTIPPHVQRVEQVHTFVPPGYIQHIIISLRSSSRSFSCGAFALGRHFPALPSRPIHPLPLLCFRPNPPHHRLNNRHNMSAIFNFSSLLTVLLLVICTCAYLRDLRPTIFDSGQVRTENKPLQTNTGERNYSIINNLTFLSAPFLETDSSTG